MQRLESEVRPLSIWTEDVFTLDNLLHVGGGILLSLPILAGYWEPWSLVLTMPIVVTIVGLLREQAQSKDEGWLRPFTRLHKWLEGVAWGVGSAMAMTVGFLIWRLA